MAEKQPISGKFVEYLQKRYVANRIAGGTATKDSFSEPVLYHLKTRGIIGGFKSAIDEIGKSCERVEVRSSLKSVAVTLVVLVGSSEFLLTACGIGTTRINDSGT